MDEADPVGLETALSYTFRSSALLQTALVHRSAPNERPDAYPDSNERLEFLGDAVLDLIIAHTLYERYPEAAEGALTRYKAAIVSEWALANVAREISLGSYLVLGRGEAETKGRDKASILSDALEAVLGAIYLDGGTEAVEPAIQKLFGDALAAAHERTVPRGDYKTALQEWTQAHNLGLPAYRLLDASGPDHARIYTAAVFLDNREISRGSGPSKREAERLAAQTAFLELSRGAND